VKAPISCGVRCAHASQNKSDGPRGRLDIPFPLPAKLHVLHDHGLGVITLRAFEGSQIVVEQYERVSSPCRIWDRAGTGSKRSSRWWIDIRSCAAPPGPGGSLTELSVTGACLWLLPVIEAIYTNGDLCRY
jgi:hypothetical protein